MPIVERAGDVLVKVNANKGEPSRMAGYHNGPRYPGDTFLMPRQKDGSPPKGSWFKVVGQPDKPSNVEDMA